MLEGGIHDPSKLVPLATKEDEARKVRETAIPDGIHIREMVHRMSPLSWSFRELEPIPRGRGKFNDKALVLRCKSKLVTRARGSGKRYKCGGNRVARPTRPFSANPPSSVAELFELYGGQRRVVVH